MDKTDRSERVGAMTQSVGSHIRLLRRRRGDSLAAMAKGLSRCGLTISMSGLGKLETGQRAITVDHLAAIAEYLDVPMSTLLEPVVEQPALISDGGELRRTGDYGADFDQDEAAARMREAVLAATGGDLVVQQLGAQIAAQSAAIQNILAVTRPATTVPPILRPEQLAASAGLHDLAARIAEPMRLMTENLTAEMRRNLAAVAAAAAAGDPAMQERLTATFERMANSTHERLEEVVEPLEDAARQTPRGRN